MPNPYAAYFDSAEAVANFLLTFIQAGADQLGIDPTQGAFYGDQSLLPKMPALCVVPGPEVSTPNGAGGRPMLMSFTTFVMVYYEKIQDVQLNTHASLTLANTVKKYIHTDATLSGSVIDCYCSGVEPGVAARSGGALMDASRMTFLSRSKTVLNPS